MTKTKKEKARHAAHEMVAFLSGHMELHDAMGDGRHGDVVMRALRTAYATHVRNLLEFFHEKDKRDIKYGDLATENPYRLDPGCDWPKEECEWWLQASQLAAHLSGKRPDHGDLPEWENRGCEGAIVPMIRRAARAIPRLLPSVADTLARFDEWDGGR